MQVESVVIKWSFKATINWNWSSYEQCNVNWKYETNEDFNWRTNMEPIEWRFGK